MVASGPKRILIVDDESAILQTLRFNLERNGYTVATAGDGRTAITFHPIGAVLRSAGVPEALAVRLEPAQRMLLDAVAS